MAPTSDVEVATSAPARRADPLSRPSSRHSLESSKARPPDIITLENLRAEEASTPTQEETPVATKAYSPNIKKLNFKFAAVCFALFLEGWNLGATGPLIPAIQRFYNVSLFLTERYVFLISFGTGKLHTHCLDVPGSMCRRSPFVGEINLACTELTTVGICFWSDGERLPHPYKR